ncbi:MAG: hypothetical protein HDR80_00570, partial [Bacteroides sp.]|nr:hypothetical protein [Bacteroides sp.]
MAKTIKNKISVRAQMDRHQEICARIEEISETCERENRLRNEAENIEYEALIREDQIVCMRMQAALAPQMEASADDRRREAERLMRENYRSGRQTEIIFTRDLMMVADAAAGAIVPLNIQDILHPL